MVVDGFLMVVDVFLMVVDVFFDGWWLLVVVGC